MLLSQFVSIGPFKIILAKNCKVPSFLCISDAIRNVNSKMCITEGAPDPTFVGAENMPEASHSSKVMEKIAKDLSVDLHAGYQFIK